MNEQLLFDRSMAAWCYIVHINSVATSWMQPSLFFFFLNTERKI